jgi:hypothetical protein
MAGVLPGSAAVSVDESSLAVSSSLDPQAVETRETDSTTGTNVHFLGTNVA